MKRLILPLTCMLLCCFIAGALVGLRFGQQHPLSAQEPSGTGQRTGVAGYAIYTQPQQNSPGAAPIYNI